MSILTEEQARDVVTYIIVEEDYEDDVWEKVLANAESIVAEAFVKSRFNMFKYTLEQINQSMLHDNWLLYASLEDKYVFMREMK